MNVESSRAYRKNLITNGLIYMNGEEQQVSVINMSMTGMLVKLSHESIYSEIMDDSLALTLIDFYLPQLRLAGTAEIIRANKDTLALKFKEMSYNIDNLLYKRKVYRKNMSITGGILLNNVYCEFQTINISVTGLMIRLTKTEYLTVGMRTAFEFKNLDLQGKCEVIWIELDSDNDDNSLVGLKYINLNTDNIMGIPRFSTDSN